MDFSALGGCHQPIHPIPRRSSVSSEHSSKLRFSRLFSFIPARALLFYLNVLALFLTLPDQVEAVTFAFNGFNESDAYMVPDIPWTFQSNTSCFYFDPPEASVNKSVSGRFLYPDLVQMKDPVTKQVKNFSTTFIYAIQIQNGYNSSSSRGPGISFIVVPDNVTVGAAEDYMGLFTTDTSTSAKNYKFDNHTFGVELDTFRNPEFNDPNDNHIGVNLASMVSTFTVNPVYPLASIRKDGYMEIWIDYFEADSRVDISIALYGEGKPATPQGSQTGVDLSLLMENMYIGFSTAKGIESDNVPYVYAWSFSNDGIPAPPVVMGSDATSTSPLLDGPLAAPSEVPPLSSLALVSPPSGSQPPISMANPPSPSTGAPGPTPTTKKRKTFILGLVLIITSVSLFFLAVFYRLWRVYRRPLRIFISYAGGPDGSRNNFPKRLMEEMESNPKFSRVKIFYNPSDSDAPTDKLFKALARFDVGIVFITKEYFERKWPMTELIAFVEAQYNDLWNRIRMIPLFYEFTPEELKVHLYEQTWEGRWKEMAKGPHPIEVEKCRDAVAWLSSGRGIRHASQRRDIIEFSFETVLKEVEKILCEERSFVSNLRWAKTTVLEKITPMICFYTKKRRRNANQRVGNEIGVMIYIKKLLRLLLAFSGLLIILLSVILDNSFNDKLLRFTAFGILAPIMIFLGFLASGWFPRIPLWFIAFVKRCGFLQHVVPCSPWHDNVVTDFTGKICTLEPMEQDERTIFEFPMSIKNFLNGDQVSPQRITHTNYNHSTVDPPEVATLPSEIQGQDFKTSNIPDQACMSEILEHHQEGMATGQVSSPNLQEFTSQVEDIAVEIDPSYWFRILGDERAPILELIGPEINSVIFKVQALKNTSTRDHTFDLSCTFRNKKTRWMNLTTERLSNLVQNMYQWVKTPFPIVVNESSDILHCMASQDILWAFTKDIYKFNPVLVKHRYLAGTTESRCFAIFTLISFLLALIPLIWDKKSYWFLLFLIVVPAYVLRSMHILFYFRALVCPIYMKYRDFSTLYRSKSSFIWCNEFRKKRIVNPESFWIDQDYANKVSDEVPCFNMGGLVTLPGNPFREESFRIACQGWPENDPTKQHDYELEVKFDTFTPDDICYTSVKLSFSERGNLLGTRKYSSMEIQRLQLIEKLFYCYSNPSFGGYVETIRPRSWWSQSYYGNCPRFLDICDKIKEDSTMSIPYEAATKSGYRFIIGVPF